jgi:hypothetical protein
MCDRADAVRAQTRDVVAGHQQPPAAVLSGLPAWQVTQIPRNYSQEPAMARDHGLAQRVQALAAAYGRAAPVAFGWLREHEGGPVRILAAGPGLAGGTDQGQAVLAVPAGARGKPLPRGAVAAMLARFPNWTPLAAVTDILLADDPPEADSISPSLDDGLLSMWLGPFAWLALAEPVGTPVIREMAGQAAREQLAAQQTSDPRSQLAARRASARHNELRHAASAGLWRVHLHAGGPAQADADRIAALLCASADVRGLPYALLAESAAGNGNGHAGGTVQRRDTIVNGGQWAADALLAPAVAALQRGEYEQEGPQPEAPFCASTRLLAALARPPSREVPGVRFTLRPEFDLTPETAAAGSEAVTLGQVLDSSRVPAGTLTIPLASLNRHTLVSGATGSGKSQTIRALLEAATSRGLPWLVIEPAKAEYRLMAARLPSTQVITLRPGDLTLPPAGLNPLEPASGPDGARFPLQVHAGLLRALFLAAFQADEPFPQVLAAAFTKCYENAGWDLVTGLPLSPGVRPAYPGLEDLQATAVTVVEQIGYGREVTDNVRGFVTVRIGSLRHGTAGRFLDGAHPLDFGKLLNTNVVLEIEDAGDDRDKAFLMGTVLIRLIEHLRLARRHDGTPVPGLRHLTVIEEAHRLLRQPPPGAGTGPAAHATEMFADLLAEIRAYGEGLIIAEQIPAKLIPDAIKNTAVKITHRLPAADDRAAVGATMNLTPAQSEYLVTVPPGEAAVHCDGMDYPVLARMPDGTAREASGTTPAAGSGPVIGRRSPSCGPDCQATACILAQIRAAQRLMLDDPRISVWAELAVLAHLTGWTIPAPGTGPGDEMHSMPARLRDCAFSHAADQAVWSRIPGFSQRVSPGELAAHVAKAMSSLITTGQLLCQPEEPQYLAPSYQWAYVDEHLGRASHDAAFGGRHPRSEEWERQYGQQIPGGTCTQQYHVVHRRYELDQQRDRGALTVIAWGSRASTALERAAGTSRTSDDWPQRLDTLLEPFGNPPWPASYLRRHAPAATRD